jgi:hypothetical protein
MQWRYVVEEVIMLLFCILEFKGKKISSTLEKIEITLK